MPQVSRFIIVAAIGTVFLSVSGASAKTIYVSPSGANANAGSQHSPLRSLAYAVRVARAGDTIIMRGGVYRMGEVSIDRRKGQGGQRGAYLTIRAMAGEEPVLRPGRRRLMIRADFVRIEGLHFMMPWRCDAFGHGLQIVNNKFTGPQPRYGAIEMGGTDLLIEGNEIRYSDKGGNTRDHGIYIHRGQNITIRNNRVIGTKGYGIHIYDEHKSADPSSWAAHPFVLKNVLIEGNYVARSRTRSGIIIAKGRGGHFIRLRNITVRNNVLAWNAEFGLFIREGSEIKVYNNTFFANRLASILLRNPSPEGAEAAGDVSIVNNIFVSRQHVANTSKGRGIQLRRNLYNRRPQLEGIKDESPVVGVPQFVDVGALDFHLQVGSPAIDAGVDIGLPYRGKRPDLGAFEFPGGVANSEKPRSGTK